jgi:hypothetical protein
MKTYIAEIHTLSNSYEYDYDFEEIEVVSYKEVERELETHFDEAYMDYETWGEFVETVIDDILQAYTPEKLLDYDISDLREEMIEDWM